MSTAIRSAACGLRLPARTCSSHSRPCSIVNSMSHRSRRWCSRRVPASRSERAASGRRASRTRDGLRPVRAGDDVLALGVEQDVAVQHGLAGRGVARERDPGRGVGAPVAEHHRLHGDRGAQVVGDALALAVGDGAVAVPGAEHGLDGQPQLLPRVVRARARRRRSRANIVSRRARHAAANAASPVTAARPSVVAAFRPRLRIVSIIPGIETGAPERTRHQQRVGRIAEPAPVAASTSAIRSRSSASRPSGQPAARTSRQVAVVIAKPGGTGSRRSGPSIRARFAALPPMSARTSCGSSSNG